MKSTSVELSPFDTPGAALRAQAQQRGGAEALVFPASGGRLSYAQWCEQAIGLARALLALGLAPGDHIALLAENRIEWPVVQLAVAQMGGVLVPLNTHCRHDDLGYVLSHSDSRALFLSPSFRTNAYLEMLRELTLPGLEHVITLGGRHDGCLHYREMVANGLESSAALPEVDPDRIGSLQYTSGTTGFPKGALLTHRGMLDNAYITAKRLEVGPGDRWTSIIPLFHCAGCIMSLLGCLQRGACYVGVPAFAPQVMFQVIEAERCTILSGVPTSYLAMIDDPARTRNDLSSLRAGTCGGADADSDLLRRCAQHFPIPGLVQVYGQTEASTLITCPRPRDANRLTTAGRPLDGFALRITEPNTGAQLSADQIGQIEVRGSMTMLGYYRQPEESAKALSEDGWLKTGDLGYVTAEGELCIAGGRLRDMIIRGGENIYPVEIENVLGQAREVEQAAVFGMPDPYYGEIVAAGVRLKAPAQASGLAAFCAARIARFKVPAVFYRVERFPLTPSGKIKKRELQVMAREGRLRTLS